MKRIVLSLFLLGLYGLALATVVVQVDNPRVQLGQPFRLHITVNGTQTNSVPDLTPLQKDFQLLVRRVMSVIASLTGRLILQVNGQLC